MSSRTMLFGKGTKRVTESKTFSLTMTSKMNIRAFTGRMIPTISCIQSLRDFKNGEDQRRLLKSLVIRKLCHHYGEQKTFRWMVSPKTSWVIAICLVLLLLWRRSQVESRRSSKTKLIITSMEFSSLTYS